MNLATESQINPFTLGYTEEVRGVQLDGLNEAAALANRLGAYALDTLQTAAPDIMYGDKTYAPLLKNARTSLLAELTPPLAAEALTIQAQLLRQIASGIVGEGSFSFRASDKQAGQVLKAAVELSDDKVDAAAKRPALRFPKPSMSGILAAFINEPRSPFRQNDVYHLPEKQKSRRNSSIPQEDAVGRYNSLNIEQPPKSYS